MDGIIYLDNAATTYPKPPEVYQFMFDFYKKHGYKTIKEINVKINEFDLLNYEMVRNPNVA